MYIPYGKTFLLVAMSRSSVKVKYQDIIEKKGHFGSIRVLQTRFVYRYFLFIAERNCSKDTSRYRC